MDIYDLADKSGVSLRTLKKLEKLGALNLPKPKKPIIQKIKHNLKRGNPLTAEHLLHLVKNPEDVKLFRAWEYIIQDYLEELGDAMQEKMPWHISAESSFAGNRDMEAAEKLAKWFCRFIDSSPAFADGASCNHAYLAVRMLADIPDNLLYQSLPVAARAMLNCRKTKTMAGYWHTDPKTRRTRYHRKALTFDL